MSHQNALFSPCEKINSKCTDIPPLSVIYKFDPIGIGETRNLLTRTNIKLKYNLETIYNITYLKLNYTNSGEIWNLTLMCLQHLDVFMKDIVSNFHMGMCDRYTVMAVPVYALD